MKFPRVSRRKFLATALLAAPAAVVADFRYLEPSWLKTRHLRLGKSKPQHRLIHFTDLHHKGDATYLRNVVSRINSLAPDLVCFTGDIVEEERHLSEALEILAEVRSPMFGVPGNHDYWSKISFEPVEKCFTSTGGAWLLDQKNTVPLAGINLIGITCNHANQAQVPLDESKKNVLLMHYPAWVKKLGDQKFDLMLAGHSHGGQVRIPFYGPIMVPFGVEGYDLGLYQTSNGPVYVNPGIGYIYGYHVRFNCRPEITVIEI